MAKSGDASNLLTYPGGECHLRKTRTESWPGRSEIEKFPRAHRVDEHPVNVKPDPALLC